MTGLSSSRFFFNIRSEQALVRDMSGSVFSNVEEAISAALVGGPQIAAQAHCRRPKHFEISSEDGTIVAQVPIAL